MSTSFILNDSLAAVANAGANRGTADNARPGIAIAVIGLQSFDSNFLRDGVDNNEWGQGTLAIQPSPDAISEFRVEENSMKAQFGRGGAVVNVVLHSGTNSLHGSACESIRNTVFDAVNYFSTGKPPFHLDQYGGSLGGPIRKDRTFFFVDYRGQRENEGGDVHQHGADGRRAHGRFFRAPGRVV